MLCSGERAALTMTTTASTHRRSALPHAAQLYLLVIWSAAVVASTWTVSVTGSISASEWRLAVVLAAGAAVAQLFVVVTPGNQSYHMTPVLVVAAALLLPPPLIVLVAVFQHVPEWLKERYPWYIQTFNIANYALSGLATYGVFQLVRTTDSGLVPDEDLHFFLAGIAAAATFVFVNHLLLAFILKFARGHTLRGTGLFTLQSVSTDFVISLLGVVLAEIWLENPWLAVLVLAPLVLVHRTLALPKLEAEARQDPKTELVNARYFSELLAEALEKSERDGEPLSLLVADLDLLRDINNAYGHLAGDAVLVGVAKIFREQLRPEDTAARFGGEEFALLLPGTAAKEAGLVAERIRIAVSEARYDVDTSNEPISATISIGVASFPADASSQQELINRADVAAYRAKAQGRNRVVISSDAAALEELTPDKVSPAPPVELASMAERAVPKARRVPPPAPNYLALSARLRGLVSVVTAGGVALGLYATIAGGTSELVDIAVLIGLVAVGQALALEVLDHGTISLSAVGSLAGAAMFGPRVALPIAVAVCVVDWSARRGRIYRLTFNIGVIVLSSIAGAIVYDALPASDWAFVVGGAAAGALYFAVNIGLLASAISIETQEPWWESFGSRFGWLFPHYVVYGMVGAMVAVAYALAGALALFVFAVPLILVRKSQLDYISHTEESVRMLREAAETIERQNESLTHANVALRDRATEAMESLAAAVDARDTYTAGHSRRVQEIAIAIGRELRLEEPELDSLSFAALFHDVGKLGVPDAVLLKAGPLDEDEWRIVRRHSEEGERIIGHLGFLSDATPAIRHHHEHWDGSGYPDGLRGAEIPLGARILHVADAFDSMISDRVYRSALTVDEALRELRSTSGKQFCPTCVAALDTVLARKALGHLLRPRASWAAA